MRSSYLYLVLLAGVVFQALPRDVSSQVRVNSLEELSNASHGIVGAQTVD